VQPGDVLFVMLMGHGSGEGAQSKVNLPGPDATAAEYASWLAGFGKQQVVFVNAATGSGDFVPVLTAPNRVVVTATKTSNERNESVFLRYFAGALGMDAADADKDGRLSVFEVFRFARTEVGKVYTSSNRMQTEHALVSDSLLASRVAFGKTAASADPRIAALLAERQALESEVASLRTKKASMTAAASATGQLVVTSLRGWRNRTLRCGALRMSTTRQNAWAGASSGRPRRGLESVSLTNVPAARASRSAAPNPAVGSDIGVTWSGRRKRVVRPPPVGRRAGVGRRVRGPASILRVAPVGVDSGKLERGGSDVAGVVSAVVVSAAGGGAPVRVGAGRRDRPGAQPVAGVDGRGVHVDAGGAAPGDDRRVDL
jgi:hypothetical protein